MHEISQEFPWRKTLTVSEDLNWCLNAIDGLFLIAPLVLVGKNIWSDLFLYPLFP